MEAVLPVEPVAEVAMSAQEAAWVKHRPAWTRTDTTRWLNERSALLLAWLRRVDAAGAPMHSGSMGRWLQTERPAYFQRAHDRLVACGRDDGAREKINVLRALR